MFRRGCRSCDIPMKKVSGASSPVKSFTVSGSNLSQSPTARTIKPDSWGMTNTEKRFHHGVVCLLMNYAVKRALWDSPLTLLFYLQSAKWLLMSAWFVFCSRTAAKYVNVSPCVTNGLFRLSYGSLAGQQVWPRNIWLNSLAPRIFSWWDNLPSIWKYSLNRRTWYAWRV